MEKNDLWRSYEILMLHGDNVTNGPCVFFPHSYFNCTFIRICHLYIFYS